MAKSVLSVSQPEAPESSLIELPPHARLPRLDLGVDWASPWEEFPSSLRVTFTGPRPPKYSELANNPGFRMDWIRGSLPPWAFFTACVCQVAIIWVLLLPIWGFLPKVTPTLAPIQVDLTWYGDPEYLKPIKLRAAAPKSAAPAKKTDDANSQAADHGADAFHPRQTILSVPVRVTHPRQTLIQPDAPPAAPKIVTPLPNIVQWAATAPQRPHLQLAPTNSAPVIKNRDVKNAAAPDVPSVDKNPGPIDVAASPATIARPRMILTPTSASAAQRHAVNTEPVAAPEIGATAEAGDNSLRRVVALSAAPAPPAPNVKVPEGNLAARIAISPEGTKSGATGGSGHAGSAAGESGGASGNSTAANAGAGSLPASVSVSAAEPRSGNGGIAGGVAGGVAGGIAPARNRSTLNLNPGAPSEPASARKGPANVSAYDPSEPPEKLLSGKEVYTLHLNLPNLTSASGSWLLNFAALNEDDDAPAYQHKTPIAAPVPTTTADPKYPPELIQEHVRGEVVLYAIIRADGSVDSIQVVKKLDPQLDKNAAQALALWKFRPGTRAGVPLDLEAVVHIPFTYVDPRDYGRP